MDKEIVSILQILLNSTLITTNGLQEESNSSKRQITYRINKINDMLKVKNVPLICLRADKDIIVRKKQKSNQRNFRKTILRILITLVKLKDFLYMYLMLFINMEDISINHFINSIKVSRSTVNLDFKDLIPNLGKKGIEVKNNRINGYYLVGNEMEIRRVLIKSIIETLSNEKVQEYLIFLLKNII